MDCGFLGNYNADQQMHEEQPEIPMDEFPP